MDNLVVVGCGDHFQSNVGPSLAFLEAAGKVKVIATLDLQPLPRRPAFLADSVPHIVRPQGQSLASALGPYKRRESRCYPGPLP